MTRDPLGERWPQVYREAPEVFAQLARAEDRDNVLPGKISGLASFAGRTVFEIGSGTGRWSAPLCLHARKWIASEPAAGMLSLGATHAPANLQWIRARGEQLPCKNASVERVFAAFVLANLRPKTLQRVLDEARRILSPSGELWALENHWEDDFQDMRRDAGLEVQPEIAPLTEAHGFEHVTTIATRMEFDSDPLAHATLSTILGPRVDALLTGRPRRRFTHRVCLLRWRPNA